jgi:hypothetical protein
MRAIWLTGKNAEALPHPGRKNRTTLKSVKSFNLYFINRIIFFYETNPIPALFIGHLLGRCPKFKADPANGRRRRE